MVYFTLATSLTRVRILFARYPKGASPFALEALLLFALPFVLTLQKFVALLAFGERSHQLQAAIVE